LKPKEKEGFIMMFDIRHFADSFKSTIDSMLSGKYAAEIQSILEKYVALKFGFQNRPDPREAFELIVRIKVTNSFYRPEPGELEPALNLFWAKFNGYTRTPEALSELASMVEYLSVFPIDTQSASNWAHNLLGGQASLKAYTENLYNLRKLGKKDKIIGSKGSDHYLRNAGYWDMIPRDIHERRFIIRTGMFHVLSTNPNQDPIKENSL
jgi:hypothetical protein